MEKPNHRIEKNKAEGTEDARVLAGLSLRTSKQNLQDKTFCFTHCSCDEEYKCDCNVECHCDAECRHCRCVGDCKCDDHCSCDCPSDCSCDGYCKDAYKSCSYD